MNVNLIAKKLLAFLHQKEDFETQKILSQLSNCDKKSSSHSELPVLSKPRPHLHNISKESVTTQHVKQDNTETTKPISHSLSIYDKLIDKVQKACPELRIKKHIDIKQAGIPDCDVVLFTDTHIPEVYQSLAKAIDKQLALTETVLLDSKFMGDLLTRSYKLALVSPHAKSIPSFMQHVKFTGKKQAYIGSTPLIFLDDPQTLSTSVTQKQLLWQSIKTFLA